MVLDFVVFYCYFILRILLLHIVVNFFFYVYNASGSCSCYSYKISFVTRHYFLYFKCQIISLIFLWLFVTFFLTSLTTLLVTARKFILAVTFSAICLVFIGNKSICSVFIGKPLFYLFYHSKTMKWIWCISYKLELKAWTGSYKSYASRNPKEALGIWNEMQIYLLLTRS